MRAVYIVTVDVEAETAEGAELRMAGGEWSGNVDLTVAEVSGWTKV